MSQDGRDAPPETVPTEASFAVRFDGGPSFAVPANQPLLLAAARAGVQIPSSCRNGSCRTCMCLSLRGQVSYRIDWPGLLPEEIAEGWILPCIAYPQSDLLLRWPRGTLTMAQAAE